MNIYQETEYRTILRKVVEERKNLDPGFTFQSLAEAMRIQKSYLSKVLGGRAELNPDQLFLACRKLELDGDQSHYLSLLLERSRSAVSERRDALLAEIDRHRARFLETKRHLSRKIAEPRVEKLSEYYLDPFHQLVHMGLTIAAYRADPLGLARDLGVGMPRLRSSIDYLERAGLIRRAGERIAVNDREVHLPRESALYPAWRAQVRQLGQSRIAQAGTGKAYSFTVVFSSRSETRLRLQARFLEFLKESEASARTDHPEELFQMNFDLFSWTGG